MTVIELKTLDGAVAALNADLVERLRGQIRGEVCLPGDPSYDAARTVWNAMIDRKPAVVVRPRDARDVEQAVRFAREHRLLLAVRGGGHNIAGNAVCEGGIMIDLTPMKSIQIDAAKQTARVEPGVTLGEFDAAAQAHGLATPLGINSTTGVAGLTLGGGFGWLSRKYGLTVDNLIGADVVTADGKSVRASATENTDLFWALRGGGGNFGVVTAFEYRLHPVGPEVLAGLVVHHFADAASVLEQYRKECAKAPDELTVWAVMRKAPPLPFLDASVHGKGILVIAMCHSGTLATADRDAAPFRKIGKPIADVVGPSPFAGWQQAFDPLLTPGSRNYWKSHAFETLSDDAVRVMIEYADKLPTDQCEIFIGQMGGATNRVPVDATAYPHRTAQFMLNVHTRWDHASEDAKCVKWAREFFDATAPFANGGVYVNFMPEDEKERVKGGAYGPNYERLTQVKRKYDPENLFRMNQNVPPSAGA